ncbi:MAG: hypothetical protein PWP27_1451 [Clostridiales bacterium]|jgi:Mn2+/Fe2+ NRAMP family transporter|nr:hypothetical protein [Clostridiales bacterium]
MSNNDEIQLRKDMITYPEPDPRLKSGKLSSLLAFMGPGLIIASVSIGSGEVFFSSRGGAIFSYVFLWAFLLGIIIKGFAIYSGGRYIALTGEHPLTRWGQIFPGPKNWFPVVIGILAAIAFPSFAAGFAKFLGQWSVWVFGFGVDNIWAVFYIIVVAGLVLFSNYGIVEKIQTWIVAFMLFMVIVAVFVSSPDWGAIFGGLIPSIPSEYASWIVEKYPKIAGRSIPLEVITYLGALGGGTYDYIGYIGLYREKKWGLLGNPNLKQIQEQLLLLENGKQLPLLETPNEIAKARSWLKAIKADIFASFAAVFIFSAAFMILGAVILNPQQVIPNDLKIMQYQSQFLTHISPILLFLYQAGVFCAFFGTMYACSSEVYVWTFYESFSPASKKIRDMGFKKLTYIVLAIYGLGGIILILTGLKFTTLVGFASLIGGVFSIGLWALAMVYTDKKIMPKAYQMSSIVTIIVTISGIALTFMGIIAILQFFKVM